MDMCMSTSGKLICLVFYLSIVIALYDRDGSIRKIAINEYPALAVSLLTQHKHKDKEHSEASEELLNRWIAAVDVSEQQTVQSMLEGQ